MAGELFEVSGGELDLSSPHLWWLTNLHLLTLSVTVNKTEGKRAAFGAQQELDVQHMTTLWMKR